MATPKIAAVFTCYEWDEFNQRQYQRFVAKCEGLTPSIVYDCSRKPFPDPTLKNVYQFDANKALGMGFAFAYYKNLFWWNLDYLMWMFVDQNPDCDYYMFADYDAVFNIGVESLVREVARQGVDFVGETIPETTENWVYRKPHLPLYGHALNPYMIPVVIFSNRAAHFLKGKRLEQSEAYRRGDMPFWPFCEAFIGSELAIAADFRCDTLGNYVNHPGLHWDPIHRESELPELSSWQVLHPVLDDVRYIKTRLKYSDRTKDVIKDGLDCIARVKSLPLSTKGKLLLDEVRHRVRGGLQRRFGSPKTDTTELSW